MDTKEALIYCHDNKILGDYVECGVYTGMHPKIACETILDENLSKINIYMYDTFEGLTEPGENDFTLNGSDFSMNKDIVFETWKNHKDRYGNNWCESSLDFVKNNVESTGYDIEKLFYIVGDIRKTLAIKNNLPKKISVLRLDTDWYDSTKIEIETLYDLVSEGGVIIIDDYFLWNGQRKAIDDFLSNRNLDKNILNINNKIGYFIK